MHGNGLRCESLGRRVRSSWFAPLRSYRQPGHGAAGGTRGHRIRGGCGESVRREVTEQECRGHEQVGGRIELRSFVSRSPDGHEGRTRPHPGQGVVQPGTIAHGDHPVVITVRDQERRRPGMSEEHRAHGIRFRSGRRRIRDTRQRHLRGRGQHRPLRPAPADRRPDIGGGEPAHHRVDRGRLGDVRIGERRIARGQADQARQVTTRRHSPYPDLARIDAAGRGFPSQPSDRGLGIEDLTRMHGGQRPVVGRGDGHTVAGHRGQPLCRGGLVTGPERATVQIQRDRRRSVGHRPVQVEPVGFVGSIAQILEDLQFVHEFLLDSNDVPAGTPPGTRWTRSVIC